MVESEFEALLLEANLVKRYQPKYNIRLKDDKSYLYIKITASQDFPKVLTCRRKETREGQTFGPFPSAKTVRNTLKSLRKIFPYCNCNFKVCQKRKSCLWWEIGLDAGPCLGLIDKKSYRKIIRHLLMLLSGKKEKLLKALTKEMTCAAKKEEFERAQFFKKQIEGIGYLTHPEILGQTLGLKKIPVRVECYDISDIHGRQATGSLVVFQKGEPDKSGYRRFKVRLEGKPNDVAMIKEIIKRRLGHPEWPTPDLIVIDGGKGQVSGVLRVLTEAEWETPVIGLAKRNEEIIVPEVKTGKQQRGIGKIKFRVLRLAGDSPALHLLERIRDEAHRFALAYHRKLRLKALITPEVLGS